MSGDSDSDELVHELRRTLSRMEVALGLLPDAVVWTDQTGRIRWCNGAFDRILSLSHIEILGADFAQALPLAGADHPAARAARGEQDGEGRYTYRSRLLDFHWKSTRWEEEDVHVFLIRDLTESQRTLERLEAAQKELESFSYSVAHDLRAPLRHIDGFIQMLRKNTAGKLDARGVELLDKISHSAMRLGALIDEFLAFSKTARTDLQTRPVALGGIVAEVIAESEPELKGRKVQWQVSSLPEAVCDAGMIKLVFVNLIDNALKFTRGRSPAVIEIGPVPGPPGEIVVRVRDNGVGFDMRFADKLFGVFQRLHRMEDFEGTGIGLANVRRIVAKHGGRTWAEGEVDKGAAFYFSLPAPEAQGEP